MQWMSCQSQPFVTIGAAIAHEVHVLRGKSSFPMHMVRCRSTILFTSLLAQSAVAQSYEKVIPTSPFSIEPSIRSAQLAQGAGSAFVLTNANIGSLGSADMLLLKVNANGDIVHDLQIGDVGGQGYHDVGMEAVQVGADIYICGYTRAIDTAASPTFTSFLIKVDTALNLQWQKNYILPGPMELYANALTSTDNGQLLIAGQVYDGSDFHTMLMKVASDGSLIWIKQYDIDFGERIHCVRELPGGDILLSGNVVFGFELVLPLVFKVNATGDFIWGKYYNYPPMSIVEHSNFLFIHAQSVDDILLCGHTDVMGVGGQDFYIVDIDSSGAVNWARTYGVGQSEFPSAAQFDAAANELVMLGNSNSFNASFTPVPIAMRIAPGNGLLLDAELYGDTATTQLATLDHCQRLDAGTRIISGWRGFPSDDLYIAGTDNDLHNTCNTYAVSPAVLPQTTTTGAFTAVVTQPAPVVNNTALGTTTFSGGTVLCIGPTVVTEVAAGNDLEVWPMPATNMIHIRSAVPVETGDRIELVDQQGRIVLTMAGNGASDLRLERGATSAGAYVLRIRRAGGRQDVAPVVFD